MTTDPLKVAWISEYPIEWMEDLPESLRHLPKDHLATWMSVLLGELHSDPRVKIHVLVLRKGLDQDVTFERNGVTFHVLRVPKGMRATSMFWLDTLVLKRRLRQIQPDLVHAWGTERGAALVASRLRYPYLITMQGLLNWYRELIPVSRYERFAAFLETLSLRRARWVTTESTFAVNYLTRHHPHLRIHQAEHASSWHFHRIQRDPQHKPPRFISVGTINYRKGSDLVLKAFNQLAPEFPFELVIIGAGGELFQSLKPELSPEFVRRIEFKTNLRPAQVAEEMSRATIKIMPTRADTSPNAVKEAVVSGLPVVGSVIGGIPDYVFPGLNGCLFPSEDLPAFIQAVRECMHHPLLGQGRVDESCLVRTREYLSPSRMKQRFLEAYFLTLNKPMTEMA